MLFVNAVKPYLWMGREVHFQGGGIWSGSYVKNEKSLPHYIPNLCDVLSSIKHKKRNFDECSCCSFSYNKGAFTLKKHIIKAHMTYVLYSNYLEVVKPIMPLCKELKKN